MMSMKWKTWIVGWLVGY